MPERFTILGNSVSALTELTVALPKVPERDQLTVTGSCTGASDELSEEHPKSANDAAMTSEKNFIFPSRSVFVGIIEKDAPR